MIHKLLLIGSLTLLLIACGDPRTTTGVLIDIQEWTCSKTEIVAVNNTRMVGRMPVKEVENRHTCVQWTRMGIK